MAQITVDDLQAEIAAVLDQNEATSAISTADYSLRLKYLNMSLKEWARANQWQALYKEYNMLVSTSSMNASIALPIDFSQPASQPVISYDSTTTDNFLITKPQDAPQYDSLKKRVEFLGNPMSGYVLRVYGTALISGASVKVPYYSSPQSLASPANIVPIPDPNFLVKRTLGYWWEAREDSRFPSAKAEAQAILQNMITLENVFPQGSDEGRVQTIEEKQHSFRIGRD